MTRQTFHWSSLRPNGRRIGAIARVETQRLINDPALLIIIFLLPIVQILLYGYAINLNPQHVRLAMASDDVTLTQPATDQIRASSAVKLVGPVGAPGAAEKAVRTGHALIGVEVRKASDGKPVSVHVFADAGNPQTVGRALVELQTGVWKSVAQNYAADDAPKMDVRWIHNGRASADIPDSWSVTPGLVGVIVMITMLFLGSFTLVRERENGSWETLLATPVTPIDALIGKLSPYLVIGLGDTLILLGLTHVLFGVDLPPATWALVAAAPLFAASYLILGFSFSAIAHNQLQAAQGAVFFYLPSLMLSGFLFPFEGMPKWAQVVGSWMPLTHYVEATRDVLIRGRGAEAVWTEMVPVLAFTVVVSVVAMIAYRRRLD
jgi:ABC-2 type transport system permease protein